MDGTPEGTDLLFTEQEIDDAVRRIGREVSGAATEAPPVLVAVLKGSVFFLSDLVRAIDVPIQIEIMAISSFTQGGEHGGRVRIMKDLDADIAGRDVILVEDIIDTGLTGAYLSSTLRSRGATSIRVCTLLDKSARRIAPLTIDHRGFDCPDRFVIGYGLDHTERFRSLRSIYAADDPGAVDESSLLAYDRLLASRRLDTVEPR